MNTILLNFSSIDREKIILPCQAIELNESLIVVKSLLAEKSKILLLEVKHNQINTLLDLTNVTPYELWYFDQDQLFTGKGFSLQNSGQLFQIQTQARYIVLIPRENESIISSKLLANFNCHSFQTTIDLHSTSTALLKGFETESAH